MGNSAVEEEMASPDGLVLRDLKRRKVLLALSLKYSSLGEEVLGGILPNPDGFQSKRQWETKMQAVREKLRELAPEVGCVSSESAGSLTLQGTLEDDENTAPRTPEVDDCLSEGFEFGEFLGNEYVPGEATSPGDYWI